jgi:hypothetical protein
MYALAASMCGISPLRREEYYEPIGYLPMPKKKRINRKKAAQKAQRKARKANRK